MRTLLQLVVALILAVVAYALLGYVTVGVLGLIYGWGGHPAMPAAPWNLYVFLFFILLPIACLAGAWYAAGVLIRASIRRAA